MNKMTTPEMECALARWFNIRQTLVVPNVSWGFHIHECDLLVVAKTGYVTEVEIKVTKADLINDKKKKHQHESKYIKFLYFAIPYYLKDYIDKIPNKAGILIVSPKKISLYNDEVRNIVSIIKEPQVLNKYRLSNEERYKIARLGALRIWGLKEKLLEAKSREV